MKLNIYFIPHIEITIMNDIEDLGNSTKTAALTGIVIDLVGRIKSDEDSLDLVLRKLSKTYRIYPSKSELITVYQSMVANGSIAKNAALHDMLKCRVVRSASGVLPVTTVMRPDKFSCSENCAYCPDERKVNGAEYDMPKSYLSSEPAVKRAMQSDWFDCVTQVDSRLERLEENGHTIDKIEMIVEGGTFSHYPKDYQEEYVRDLFYACNTYKHSIRRTRLGLAEEKFINETTKYRIIGIVLETRPDCINKHEIKRLRYYGCTRVQIGVQHTDNEILDYIQRGHKVEDSMAALKMLKDNGFKVDIHLMPDLPGATPAKDKAMFDFVLKYMHPDYAKIYPCLDVEYTAIRQWKKDGRWKPYAEQNGGKDLVDVLLYLKRKIPRYLRINRLQRDFPESHENNKQIGYVSENIRSNLRQLLLNELEKQGGKCLCIRCREVGLKKTDLSKAELSIEMFESCGGVEYFISYVNKEIDVLYGFCRLRLPGSDTVFDMLKFRTAFVRELHVYGSLVDVHTKGNDDGHQRI